MVRPVYPKRTEQKRKNQAKKAGSAARRASASKMANSYSKSAATTARKSAAARRTVSYSRGYPSAKKARASAHRPRRAGLIRSLFISDRKAGEMDYTFLLLVGVLAALGLIMLLSASTPTADVKFKFSYHFFVRQLAYFALGTVAMLIISRIDYRKYKRWARPFMIFCIILLAMVFVPKIGVSHNGSRRWINLGITEIQPSEFTKFAICIFFASLIEDKRYNLQRLDDLVRICMWIGAVAVLMMLETHLSGTIVLCGIAICILIVGGMQVKYLITGGALAGCAAAIFLYFNPVRMARITSFLNPFADKQASGYQTIQSLYAIGSGGIFGKGLGQSVQKFSYLPEPYSDFIFAIVCEELGLLGAAFIIGLFAFLILRGIKIASEAPDTFGSLMTVGIMAQVAIQTVLNIAVVTSSIPNTGVPLPFFSYGGTALTILLMEMGVVLSVSRYSKRNQ